MPLENYRNLHLQRLLATPEFKQVVDDLAPTDHYREAEVAHGLKVPPPTLRAAVRAWDEQRGVTRLALVPARAQQKPILRFMPLTPAPKPVERQEDQEQTRVTRTQQLARQLKSAAMSHHIAEQMELRYEADQLLALGRDIIRVAGMVSLLPSPAFLEKQSPLMVAALEGKASKGEPSFDNAPEFLQRFLNRLATGSPDVQRRGSLFPNPAPPREFLVAPIEDLWDRQAYEMEFGLAGSRRAPNPDAAALLRGVAGVATQSAALTAKLREIEASPVPDYVSDMQRLLRNELSWASNGQRTVSLPPSGATDSASTKRMEPELPNVGARALQLYFGNTAQHLLRATVAPVLATVAANLVTDKSEWSAIPQRNPDAMRALGGVMWIALLRSGGDIDAFTRGKGSVKAGVETYKLTAAAGLPLRLNGPPGSRMFPPQSATTFVRTTFDNAGDVLAAELQATPSRSLDR